MVVVLMNASVQGVLDRNYRVCRLLRLQGAEHFVESRAGKDVHVGSQQFPGGGVAERARLALKRDFRLTPFPHRRYHPIEAFSDRAFPADRARDRRNDRRCPVCFAAYDKSPEWVARRWLPFP